MRPATGRTNASETSSLRKGFSRRARQRARTSSRDVAPGDCEGGPDNRHRGADQWLFVVSGRGVAIVNGRRVALRAGSILLIEKGDLHEIRNTGRTMMKTVNVYVPPAYRSDGEELPRGRR